MTAYLFKDCFNKCFIPEIYEIISLSNNIGGDGIDNNQTADIDELIQDDKDLNIAEDEGEGLVLTEYLIRKGLKYTTSLEQHFLAHDPDIDRVLQFQSKLKSCVAGYQELSIQLEKPKKKKTTSLNRLYNKTSKEV